MDKCFCGGKIEIQNVEYKLVRGKRTIIIKDVPAYVCQECGAAYYDTDVLDEAFKNKDKYEYISTK
ncbi:YgiT-type zinc finger domain-containing protein [Thermoanaerobacter kivui]|uniref:YgiT-type zinc finger domain-containing protein n=1 Tax=Thermoanaerobacter kivui TaxID=2325 RepID=A0A097ASL5_THEKI|nr:YgiT-type zinc finger protein [Thermoanaerobacter kivui]AIS52816.1 YgiT-type zinc finger domain-containing protein [Thermoanaerobacter kivui]